MRGLITFAAAMLFAGVTAYPFASQAKYRRSHVDECYNLATNSLDGYTDPPQYLRCPFMDNDNFTHAEVTNLSVYVYDGCTNYGVGARVCVTFAQSSGGSCGSYSYTSVAGTGFLAAAPAVTKWSDYPSDFAWVGIYSNCSSDIIKGYKANNN
jgi:hypothetical protein